MNCLVCGHKLAIFRKLSLGDFCCQEHRALFLREQNEGGLARLMEANGEPKPREAGTRVYAQFLHEDLPASANGADSLGYGPLTQAQVIGPETQRMSVSRLAPVCMLECAEPQVGVTSPIYFEVAGLCLRLPESSLPVLSSGANTRLQRAGLILPWSSGAGSHTAFSLAPLVAAAWAQSGYSKPITAYPNPIGELPLAWPRMQGTVEIPFATREMGLAAFAAVEAPLSEPMRVRLANPSVVAHKPQLELPLPAFAAVEEYAAPVSEPLPAAARTASKPATDRWGWLSKLVAPPPKPDKALAARARARQRNREEMFSYDEPDVPARPSSSEAWRAMLTGWTPPAAAVSGLFAVLFLFSAVTIFLSAPSELSQRSPSWRWDNLRAAIRSRASLKFEDDFRTGLGRWKGPTGWSLDWSFDPAGFVRPGKLGFLEQSMKLVDYRMELMGQIERKSIGWAFRAKDENNYYVAKLTITRPGPLPMVNLIHYPVTDGREGTKVSVALPFAVRNDTLYDVEMNVRGDQFRASVNGHVVDSWSDNRLRAGGVGFVSGQGEAARVRWIRVSDRDDVIGRVCSYLSARSSVPFGDSVLSASYYPFLTRPGLLQVSK